MCLSPLGQKYITNSKNGGVTLLIERKSTKSLQMQYVLSTMLIGINKEEFSIHKCQISCTCTGGSTTQS